MSETPEKPHVNPFSNFALAFTAASIGYGFAAYKFMDEPALAKFYMIGTVISGGATAFCITAGKVWETYKKPEPENPPAP